MKDAAKWAAVLVTVMVSIIGSVWVMSQTFATNRDLEREIQHVEAALAEAKKNAAERDAAIVSEHDKDLARIEEYFLMILERLPE